MRGWDGGSGGAERMLWVRGKVSESGGDESFLFIKCINMTRPEYVDTRREPPKDGRTDSESQLPYKPLHGYVVDNDFVTRVRGTYQVVLCAQPHLEYSLVPLLLFCHCHCHNKESKVGAGGGGFGELWSAYSYCIESSVIRGFKCSMFHVILPRPVRSPSFSSAAAARRRQVNDTPHRPITEMLQLVFKSGSRAES